MVPKPCRRRSTASQLRVRWPDFSGCHGREPWVSLCRLPREPGLSPSGCHDRPRSHGRHLDPGPPGATTSSSVVTATDSPASMGISRPRAVSSALTCLARSPPSWRGGDGEWNAHHHARGFLLGRHTLDAWFSLHPASEPAVRYPLRRHAERGASGDDPGDGYQPRSRLVGSFRDPGGQAHGFLCMLPVTSACFTQLDSRNGMHTEILGLNDRGQMVGRFRDPTGLQHGFTTMAPGAWSAGRAP